MAAIASAITCSLAGGMGSMYLATFLFSINAPNAHEIVQRGWGFQLYAALVAGGIMGALTAFGLVIRHRIYCLCCGAISAILLLALMPSLSFNDFWEGPDLLAVPFLLALVLLAWGMKLKRRPSEDP